MGPGRKARSGRWGAATAVCLLARGVSADPTLPLHDEVPETGAFGIATADVRLAGGPWRTIAWDSLESLELAPGLYALKASFEVARDGDALELPPCAGLKSTAIDGRAIDRPAPGAPLLVPIARGTHTVVESLAVGRYERRIACGGRPRVGATVRTIEGLGAFDFDSPHRAKGGGHAVAFVPFGHDPGRPGALLVGAHPWNGTVWTYAAYAKLLTEASARDVVLLMPSGLGNSLYTSDAEDEVLRAIDALAGRVAVDGRRVSIWGASMGERHQLLRRLQVRSVDVRSVDPGRRAGRPPRRRTRRGRQRA
jgi:hypothetical protein